jgi:S-DNA-T family DNA segregation ATPase FtsK/SpoIIIE
MSRRKASKKQVKNKRNNYDPAFERPRLFSAMKEETRYGIWAVVFFVISAFFILSSVHSAGKAGEAIFNFLHYLFGGGFYLIPVIFIALGISFLRSMRPNFMALRLLAGLVLFLVGLATSGVLVEESGGLVGTLIAKPFLLFLDLYASLVIFGAVAVIGLLILFDTHLSLEPKLFGFRLWGRKIDDENDAGELSELEDETVEEAIVEAKIPEEAARPEPEAIKMKDSAAVAAAESFISFGRTKTKGDFTPPPLSLLEKDSGRPGVGDIKANANIIKRTLANFGIVVEMDEVSIGPSITRYALKPAEGVRLAQIITLQRDLELALAAHPIRIEAPIPGKSLVGIELPNSTKTTVGLGTLLGTKEFGDSITPLLLSLGRGISGMAHYANLSKAPHLLIAGATGSGKSVTIHTLIVSLLYRQPPENLRFIMIDPKRVELTLYNKIPHLLTPVITDPKKAIAALRWAASEMDRRYNILEQAAVRDIQSYHKEADFSSEDTDRMPYIVIIIDELADIMSTYPRELEAAIVRLAQMSRAVGIHLVISTQRPSVEVITGLIKANIPSRIALQVASQIDSRTIIDMAGAEKLLGAGDMLYLGGEMSKPIRLQSAFIGEVEVKKVVKFLADQYEDLPPSDIVLPESNMTGKGLFSTALDDNGDDDELYEDAREAVMQAGKASASYLQRKLKVGYARAARLIDMMEERGVIGPGEGAKPREVYGGAGDNNHDNPTEEI